ncbi:MAG: carbonic anhydrase [Helicobacteraceae bacterium]|nr:carbonic anhydrase [Helicobacteraceae bacterium]
MIIKSALLNGNEMFKNSYFKKHEKELLDLVEFGQSPKALFIGCADSRVIPNLITQTAPGELFVLRNVGNFVAPYKPDEDYHATASGIEYAVSALEVSEIIICGHTHCGAIASLYTNIDEKPFVHTKKWLSLGKDAQTLALRTLGEDAQKDELLRLTEKLSVVSQIEHLLTYPFVKERVDAGKLHIHGWMYDIANGDIEYYDPDECEFKSLSDIK